jgi:hypothetical protein
MAADSGSVVAQPAPSSAAVAADVWMKARLVSLMTSGSLGERAYLEMCRRSVLAGRRGILMIHKLSSETRSSPDTQANPSGMPTLRARSTF